MGYDARTTTRPRPVVVRWCADLGTQHSVPQQHILFADILPTVAHSARRERVGLLSRIYFHRQRGSAYASACVCFDCMSSGLKEKRQIWQKKIISRWRSLLKSIHSTMKITDPRQNLRKVNHPHSQVWDSFPSYFLWLLLLAMGERATGRQGMVVLLSGCANMIDFDFPHYFELCLRNLNALYLTANSQGK